MSDMRTNPTWPVLIAMILLVGSVARGQEISSKCAAITRFQAPGVVLEITNAQLVPAGTAPVQGRGGRGSAAPNLPY